MLPCVNEKAGIGPTCEKRYPIGVSVSMYLTKPNFYFPNAAALADRDTVLAAAAAGNIIIVHKVKEVEPEDVDDGVNESSLGSKSFGHEGQRGGLYSTMQPLENHKFLRSLNGSDFGVIYVDVNKSLVFTQLEDGRVTGVELDYFRVKKLPTLAAGVTAYTGIQIQEADNDDIDRYGCYLTPTWNPTKVFGPNQVVAVPSIVASNAFTVSVVYVNNGKKDPLGLPIEQVIPGLLAVNFYVENEDGDVLVPDTDFTAVEQIALPGTYDIDATVGTIVTGLTRVVASVTKMYVSPTVELSDS